MINFSTSILSSEATNGPGGLFDIGATLPLVAIQFLLLMVILNVLLYNPLLTIIEERKEYILTNLNTASELLVKANSIINDYQEKITRVRKETQLDIVSTQKIYKEILDIEVSISQKYINNFLEINTKSLNTQRMLTLDNLDGEIKTLCEEMKKKMDF